MTKKGGKRGRITKGMPSAVLLSIAIHAALFFLAGALVVFTVVKKKEIEFTPPKAVERPKMKLKKPKVKVRKTSKPKPTQRIVTKMSRASMPDIQLPEMSGMGEGLGDVVSGFDLMPDLGSVSVFGGGQSIGNDFVGTFHDFKRDRGGRNIPIDPYTYFEIARRFIESDWKPSELGRFYQSPKKLYATMFVVPPLPSVLVPSMFGEPKIEGAYWGVLYKGKLVHKDGITFRFRGSADAGIAVRVDGEIVLLAPAWVERLCSHAWRTTSADSYKHKLGSEPATVGDWITLEPGVPLDMEVFLFEGGSIGCFMLAIEEKGVEYERRTVGGPTFPAFKTAEPSRDLLDAVYWNMVPGELNLTNGPVFNDYGEKFVVPPSLSAEASAKEEGGTDSEAVPEPAPQEPESPLRTWTGVSGKTLEAELVVVIGDKAVLKTPEGKTRRIPLAELSVKDREYIELANPPVMKIDFGAKTKRVFSVSKLYPEVPIGFDYCAKVKLKQTSAGAYSHELKVEFFAIGEEIHGDKHVLLDRQQSSFTPTKENQRSHEFTGRKLQILDFIINTDSSRYRGGKHRHGERPSGYLITVTDSRGIIVQHEESSAWLYENIENLKKLPVGAYMDKTATRVFPTGSKQIWY